MVTISIILSYMVLAMLFAHWQILVFLKKNQTLKLSGMHYSEYVMKYWVSVIAFPFLLIGIFINFLKNAKHKENRKKSLRENQV